MGFGSRERHWEGDWGAGHLGPLEKIRVEAREELWVAHGFRMSREA